MTLDIIIFAVIIIATIKYYNQGLIKSILYAIANIASLFASLFFARTFVSFVNDKIIYPVISSKVNQYISDNIDLHSLIEQAVGDDVSFLQELLIDFSQSDLNTMLSSSMNESILYTQEKLAYTLAYGLSYLILLVIGFIIARIAAKIIVGIISVTLRFTKLSGIDKLLGGGVGFIMSASIACILVWTSYCAFPSVTTDFYSEENLQNSYIVKHIIDHTPEAFVDFVK